MSIEQTAALAKFIINGFSAGDLGVTFIEGVANNALILATDRNPALFIKSQAYPGSFIWAG